MEMTADELIASWERDPIGARHVFSDWRSMFQGMPEIEISFKSRPGISHSLRLRHKNQTRRNLFALIDVVDDDPDNRWLSVCFYADLVSDPEERGDLVPAGLDGEDAMCFNMDEADPDLVAYIRTRLEEAAQKAA